MPHELTDVEIVEVSLVAEPATGRRFAVYKSADAERGEEPTGGRQEEPKHTKGTEKVSTIEKDWREVSKADAYAEIERRVRDVIKAEAYDISRAKAMKRVVDHAPPDLVAKAREYRPKRRTEKATSAPSLEQLAKSDTKRGRIAATALMLMERDRELSRSEAVLRSTRLHSAARKRPK